MSVILKVKAPFQKGYWSVTPVEREVDAVKKFLDKGNGCVPRWSARDAMTGEWYGFRKADNQNVTLPNAPIDKVCLV